MQFITNLREEIYYYINICDLGLGYLHTYAMEGNILMTIILLPAFLLFYWRGRVCCKFSIIFFSVGT